MKTWATGDTLTAADLNAEFNNIVNDYNGNITNANIAGAAAIAYAKLSLVGSIVNADISGSAAIAYSKLNLSGSIVAGDHAANSITSSKSDTTMMQNLGGGNYKVQTGEATTSASGPITITFPSAFVGTAPILIGNVLNNSTPAFVVFETRSATQCTVSAWNVSGARVAVGIEWMAIST